MLFFFVYFPETLVYVALVQSLAEEWPCKDHRSLTMTWPKCDGTVMLECFTLLLDPARSDGAHAIEVLGSLLPYIPPCTTVLCALVLPAQSDECACTCHCVPWHCLIVHVTDKLLFVPGSYVRDTYRLDYALFS